MSSQRKVCAAVRVALATAVVGTTTPFAAFAQDAGAPGPASTEPIRVTVTGTNIPGVDRETGLPVQIIGRQEIEQGNFQTALQLASTISAVVGYGSFNENSTPAGSSNPGFASAGLRGLNAQRTLVLLNGRRLANYTFIGSGVDLNSIPISALDRVEVLLDGASAIYGSDAIGGVINFITRREFEGFEATAQYSAPERDGGWSDHFTALAGYGSLANQRFNAFATVDYQQFGGLPARNRDFSKSFFIPGMMDQTSGSSFPGNVIVGGTSRNPTGDPTRGYANPPCNPPASFTTISPLSCRLDPAYFINAIAPSERFATTVNATWQIGPEHQLFVNGLYTHNTFTFLASPTSVPNRAFLQPSSPFYPHDFARTFGVDGQPLNVAWRSYELGPRTDEPIVEQWNLVAGLRGTWNGWTYDGALNFGQSLVDDRYTSGYLLASVINPLLNSGRINPFGYNTPDVLALMSTAEIDQTVRRGTSTMSAIDLHGSKEMTDLAGGPLAIAVGMEVRRWNLAERSSDALATGNIVQVGATPSLDASRTSWAVFAEASLPLSRTFEADLAVRYDGYNDVGSTTNPKISLRWQPDRTLVFRGSAGTGFRAPGLEGLYQAPISSLTNLTQDPARCPTTRSPTDCNTTFRVLSGGNPALRNETSSQWGVGVAWSPVPGSLFSADYFDIVVDDLLFGYSPQTALDLCKDGVSGPTCAFVVRGPPEAAHPTLPGPIQVINSGLFNLGTIHSTGVDVNLQYRFPSTQLGQFTLSLQGTYTIKFEQQQTDGSYLDRVNHMVVGGAFGPIPYWHHYLTLGWSYGPWTATVSQNYQMGTYDQNPNPGEAQLRKIGDFEVWNLSGSYSGIRGWTLSLGVKNLMDRNPPFTNQTATANAGGPAGYDPTYADPRGRTWWASVRYAFK